MTPENSLINDCNATKPCCPIGIIVTVDLAWMLLMTWSLTWHQDICNQHDDQILGRSVHNRIDRMARRVRVPGPTWGPSGADRTQVGPMLAPWTLLSGVTYGQACRTAKVHYSEVTWASWSQINGKLAVCSRLVQVYKKETPSNGESISMPCCKHGITCCAMIVPVEIEISEYIWYKF